MTSNREMLKRDVWMVVDVHTAPTVIADAFLLRDFQRAIVDKDRATRLAGCLCCLGVAEAIQTRGNKQIFRRMFKNQLSCGVSPDIIHNEGSPF